jgi:hypothetical protein
MHSVAKYQHVRKGKATLIPAGSLSKPRRNQNLAQGAAVNRRKEAENIVDPGRK